MNKSHATPWPSVIRLTAVRLQHNVREHVAVLISPHCVQSVLLLNVTLDFKVVYISREFDGLELIQLF